MTDPDTPRLIYACMARDHRYMASIDEREVYLARLVRDLHLPLEPIAGCGSELAARVLRLLAAVRLLGAAALDHARRWVELLRGQACRRGRSAEVGAAELRAELSGVHAAALVLCRTCW